MISRKDIKNIVIFKHLTDEMINKLLPEMELLRFTEGEMIFSSGERADMFYSLKRGKILLEQRVLNKVTISVGTVKPGYSFGWSALLGDQNFTLDTVCGEPCEVLRIKAETLFSMIEEDWEMGYRLMHRLLHMVRRRLDGRTELLLKIIMDHPDMLSLAENNQS
ncbi:MAG: cyclic nucleotide-binding domain-containing protein [Desulfofustis sp.]|nr:cyclic nucleotide-binding domain-containing protein [Desulfofustis sp.]MBT8354173.1 cyclic nucleotide-binding domain-containing protein [Desulfofustis sp.]